MTDEELIARLRELSSFENGVGVMQDFYCGEEMLAAADRMEALVKERDGYKDICERREEIIAARTDRYKVAEDRIKRLETAVLAAAKIGQIVGFLGEDEGRIEAFREACGPELWDKARTALKGADHV